MEGKMKVVGEPTEKNCNLDKLLQLKAIYSHVDQCFNQIVSMCCACSHGDFPFMELEESLQESFTALNHLECQIYRLEDYLNESLGIETR